MKRTFPIDLKHRQYMQMLASPPSTIAIINHPWEQYQLYRMLQWHFVGLKIVDKPARLATISWYLDSDSGFVKLNQNDHNNWEGNAVQEGATFFHFLPSSNSNNLGFFSPFSNNKNTLQAPAHCQSSIDKLELDDLVPKFQFQEMQGTDLR